MISEEDHKAALMRARAEGVMAGLELAEKVLRAQHAAATRRVRAPQQKRPRYDWIDHVCGISLIDRMMGIR